MAKKETVAYGISFIDLLSGALGAVILLFIIVPKMDIESMNASKKLDSLGLKVDQLDSMVVQLGNSVDREVYQDVINKIKAIKNDLENSKKIVKKLEDEVKSLQVRVEDLTRYKEWMDNCGFTPEDDCPPKECPPTFEEWKNWMVRDGLAKWFI